MSVTNKIPLEAAASPRIAAEFTIKLTPFDQRHYRKLIAARAETIRRVLSRLNPSFQFSTALDAGCGVGFFTKTLEECGLNVCGFDAREENIREARKRFPGLSFGVADLQDPVILQLRRFDFVLCFGLLYHLENPLLALRHLRGLTDKCLLLESMCIPEDRPSLLLREEPRADDQSLTDIACYPSESSIVKMLYRSGFAFVYRVIPLPNHDDFSDTSEHTRRRTVLLASGLPIDVAGFRLYPEPRDSHDPWSKSSPASASIPRRIARFIATPLRRQYITMALRARRLFPGMPITLRLPFGAWWLAEKGALDHELMYNGFEEAELRIAQRFLRPGMTVLDIGAHHGLYSLLASKRVGPAGRVISFEPSPRERRRLQKHLRFNRCKNVEVQSCALGNNSGEADLFFVDGFRDWGNSLRPPAVSEPVSTVRVTVRRLDELLASEGIARVDFIKLDSEGGELAVLQGAAHLLQNAPRPALLVEVEDIRTRQWNYHACEILQLLARWNYRWFALNETGGLYPISPDQESCEGNFVALPDERAEEFLGRLVESNKREPLRSR